MAQDILNLFSGLFSGVIDWFTGNLGDLFGNLLNMFLEALVGGAQATMQDIVHGLLSSLVNEVTEGIAAVSWLPEWVKYGLTTFAGNVGSALGTIADGAITMVTEGSMEILGVTNAQEQYMTQLQNSLTVAMAALMDRIEYDQTWNSEVGEEIVTTLIDSLNRTVNATYSEALDYLQGTQLGIAGQMQSAQTHALELLGSTLLSVQHTSRVALEMIEAEEAGVITYLTEAGFGEAERFLRSIENTIVIPIANAQAMAQGLSFANRTTTEEMKESLKLAMIAMNEISVEMGITPEFDPRTPGPR